MMTGSVMTGQDRGPDDQPPPDGTGQATALRAHLAAGLFAEIPEIIEDMEARPEPDEVALRFVRRLLNSPTPEEAITFMAQLFTRRVAVWWGHECLRYLERYLEPQDLDMMALCAEWVACPDEPHRQQLVRAVESSATRSPGVWLAMAAGWSGGSLAPPDSPVVVPPRFLTGRGVNASILSALARVPRADRQETLETFIVMAHDLV